MLPLGEYPPLGSAHANDAFGRVPEAPQQKCECPLWAKSSLRRRRTAMSMLALKRHSHIGRFGSICAQMPGAIVFMLPTQHFGYAYVGLKPCLSSLAASTSVRVPKSWRTRTCKDFADHIMFESNMGYAAELKCNDAPLGPSFGLSGLTAWRTDGCML